LDDLLMKIGAAYIRVSDERQDEYSPDSQLKKIREHAAKEGVTIPDEYVFYDDGISGRNVEKRDDFNRMIAMAREKSHPFDVIYVWKFSRFARNQEQAILYKNLLRKNGVSVVSVSEPIPDGHFGTLIERIIEWMDEFYSINLGVEVSRGMEEKVSRGEPICYPPFGYYMEDKKWIPDERESVIVREVFERFADGEGMRSIAVDLGNRGIRTKQNSIPNSRWIEYMLNNPAYIGKIRQSPKGSRTISKRDYNNDEIRIVNGQHKAIISMELWNKVSERLKQLKAMYPKYAKREQAIEYMLKGLTRCSACGGAMSMSAATSGKAKTRSLQCCNYAKGICKVSHSITVPKAEKALIEGLENVIETKQFSIVPKTPKKAENATVDFDKLIALEERKLERAKQAFLAEIDTLDQYAKNKEEIAARINSLKAKRDEEAPKVEIDLDAYAKRVAEVVKFIKRTDITEKAKNEALHSIVNKIVYEKANNTLAIYFHDIQL
jgi:DNA invertase Pin-like site-specific DNA recombinase